MKPYTLVAPSLELTTAFRTVGEWVSAASGGAVCPAMLIFRGLGHTNQDRSLFLLRGLFSGKTQQCRL